ncbi:hypothetical protein [Sphingobium baderi]|uniref:hypothetical protein n=1 Tax=Sphingobium baderi TaxID=1332080 RepID=UPI002B412E94|nr:hypothetical protein [Sphingobium baderi]WRD75327.1 hypothetical protein QQ987_11010 [Sphingobium baderi]
MIAYLNAIGSRIAIVTGKPVERASGQVTALHIFFVAQISPVNGDIEPGLGNILQIDPRIDDTIRSGDQLLKTYRAGMVIDPMQAGSAMPLFRQTSRRTLHGELVVKLLPQDFCHCQR